MAIALAVAGLVCIAYGVTVMAVWSGTWFFAVWYALGAVLLAAAFAVHVGAWAQTPLVFRRIVEAACCVALACLVVCAGMSASGFSQHGEDELDYIVVLGAQVHDDRPSMVLRYRLDTARDYLEANPRTICIVSGGQGFNEPCPEADVMAAYLEDAGADPVRILRETESKNTVENIKNSMRLLDAQTDRVGVVTNNFHVYRSVGIARKLGVANVCGIAAPSSAWYLPNNVLRESLGIAKDTVTGNL